MRTMVKDVFLGWIMHTMVFFWGVWGFLLDVTPYVFPPAEHLIRAGNKWGDGTGPGAICTVNYVSFCKFFEKWRNVLYILVNSV